MKFIHWHLKSLFYRKIRARLVLHDDLNQRMHRGCVSSG